MTNQLVSYFYLITLEHKPVYVGYTNRPIKQRFAEHKRDKDFGDIEPEITLLDTLAFDFSWDINTVNRHAKQVNERERELIIAHGTQDSMYQKAVGGGQTWADVKHFVLTNADNPKFKGLPDDVIMLLVQKQRAERQRLRHVMGNTKPAIEIKLRSAITNTRPAELVRLGNVIGDTRPKDEIKLRNVIGHTIPSEHSRLYSIIGKTKPSEHARLTNVIDGTRPSEYIRLKNVITNTQNNAEAQAEQAQLELERIAELRRAGK